MKKLLLALTLVFGAHSAAHACAMFKRPKVKQMAVASVMKEAEAAEKRGNVRTAIRHYERAMNAKGKVALRAEAAFRAGKLHLAEGHSQKGIDRLKTAVRLNPEHLEAHLAIGGTDDPEKVAHLKRALAIAREGGAPAAQVIAVEKALQAAQTTAVLRL